MEPLLFIIYINDITFSSNIFKFTLYADDTTLFTTIKSPDENNSHSQLINNELSNVTNWLIANKLSTNAAKTKLIVLDHVISHNMLHTLMLYDVLHSECNPSDHSVILAKFAIDFKRTSMCTRVPGNTEQIVWDKVSAHEIHNYTCTLDTSLSNISLPLDALYCTDVFCTSHASSI